MKPLLAFIFIMLMFYAVIPTLCSRLFGIGAYRKGKAVDRFALTFDDGPDPIYTPVLLDLLSKYQIKATFFILGQRAEKFPELIRRIHSEGHVIGIHHYAHQSNWMMSPWKARQQIDHTVAIVEGITGVKPVYYRPPWGLVTIFDWLFQKKYDVVLWSLMVGDWRADRFQKRLKQKLIRGLRGGTIIVLHDSGETFGAAKDAPKYMIQALEWFLRESQQRGYSCVPIDQFTVL